MGKYLVTKLFPDTSNIDPHAPFQWEQEAESHLAAVKLVHNVIDDRRLLFWRISGKPNGTGVFSSRSQATPEAPHVEYFVQELPASVPS